MRTADRMEEFTSFIVMDILEKAMQLEAAGSKIVHLEVGEPDFDPPPSVTEAMRRAVCEGKTHYTHSLGLIELREAVAEHYASRYGVVISPERVCITTGTSGAFLLVLGALLNPGEGVAMSDPGYPCYPNFVRLLGGRPLPIPIREEEGFQLIPEAIAERLREPVKLFFISSPANPTGTVTQRRTYEWVLERGHLLLSDEIYHGLVYTDDPEFTALQVDPRAIVVNGFSKRYAMTGCRLGWVIVPEELVRPLNRLSQNLFISAPTPSQWGGVAALREGAPFVESVRREYARRRRVLIDGLRKLGLKVGFEPQGAFYVFADVSAYSRDSFDFCQRMLVEAGVAATPGIDFGKNETHRYVRFAYTRGIDRIEEGLDRLGRWLGACCE
jgi:aspartate/methionine/tyrosine aminotransferase